MKKMIEQKISHAKSNWYLWLFPVFALAISGFLLFQYLHQKGELIKILFDEASVIEPEKTRLRFRGVTVGIVKQVAISEDNRGVIVGVLLQKGFEQFAVEGSKFWLVSPKVSLQGLSGLDTVFEGPYIAVLPGKAGGADETEFKARSGTDSGDPLENTTTYFLDTANAESIGVGDAVTFRGFNVGSVTKINLSKTAQSVLVQMNIQNKFTKLVRTNTVFWRKVGIQANFGLFGSNIKVNSLDSIMHGGVEFFTPTAAGEIAKSQNTFPLLQAPPKDYEKWNPKLEFEK